MKGDPPPHNLNNNIGNCSSSGQGPAHFNGGPAGYPNNWRNGQGEHPDQNNNWHHGYLVSATVHPWYNTPGVMEVVEHHHNHMHEQFLQLICEHVLVQLNIPEGMKI